MKKRQKKVPPKAGALALVFIFLSLLISYNFSYAATTEELMHDSLARGYVAGKDNNRDEAEEHFRKAFKYAKKAGSWNGMIDAGAGLMVLGKHEDAMKFFDSAAKIIDKDKDWRGKVALGYIYITLPQYFLDKEKAALYFEGAGAYALRKKDWRGLVESAKGLMETGLQDKSLANLDSATEIAKELKSIEGMKAVAKYYKKAGQTEKSQQAIRLIDKFKNEIKEVKLPPEWWEPAGETVAGPEKISTAIQMAERESADEEIDATYKYHLELRKKDVEYKTYYLGYNYYYWYPYSYSYYYNYAYWSANPWSTSFPQWWLYDWCSYYTRGYRYDDGFYFYTGW